MGSLAPGLELLLLKRNRTAPGGSRGLPSFPAPAALTALVVSAHLENRGFWSSSNLAALPGLS